jgi:hypothetical protein
MLATTANFPTRRAPSPQIRARDTSLDGTTNGSAGINSAPNMDAGIDGATHLGGQRCAYFGRNRYWLLSRLLAWEAERAARWRVAAFPRSFPPRKAPEEAR